jgi:hypothetical protein
MGAWGPGLFSDDVACDVRDQYRELLEDQVPDDEAEHQVLDAWSASLDDDDDGPVVWLAVAATQSKLGRLSDRVKGEALRVIDDGSDMARWADADRTDRAARAKALAKLRDQLTGPQPAPKKLRKPKQKTSGLALGEVLALPSDHGVMLVRVAQLQADRTMECPVLVTQDWFGAEVPDPDQLESIPDRPMPTVVIPDPDDPWGSTHRVVVLHRDDTWDAAGFVRVGTVRPRPDDDALVIQVYCGFSATASGLRHTAARLAGDPTAVGSPDGDLRS